MATWPTNLPNPSSNYSLDPVDQTIRTDMESGAARARRRTTARNDKVTVSWLFTDAQLDIFRTWFEDATTGAAGGASWFTVNLLIGNTGFSTVEARFVGPFKCAYAPVMHWTVSAELEIR
ncbi:MAG: hypothetical protein ABFD50_07140 [Smithella sp.]